MWQDILHISKEYFAMSQKVNPRGMKTCYKDSLLLTWTSSPIHCSLFDVGLLASLVFFQELSLVLGMDTKFVWDNACQQTCLGWKMSPPWMLRLWTSLSHLKDIHTFMNYWFINQLSTTYHALTLSQLVSSQVVFVQILFPM